MLDASNRVTGLTAAILDQDSEDEDRPDPAQASTAQRTLITGISGLGKSRQKTSPYLRPGDYRLRLTARDKAGNEVADVQYALVHVDTAAPMLSSASVSMSPIRFLPSSAVDEDCQMAWQGAEATEQTLMRPRWSQPLGVEGADAWRLNQSIPTTGMTLTKAGQPYAWTSATGAFVVADVAGNRASGTISLNVVTVGEAYGTYSAPMPSGTFDRTRDRGDTFVNYRPEQEEDSSGQQWFPWSDDDDAGPKDYTFPSASGVWGLVGRVKKDEDGRYADPFGWTWTFTRYDSFKHFGDEMEAADSEFLDRVGSAAVTPLDPEASPGVSALSRKFVMHKPRYGSRLGERPPSVSGSGRRGPAWAVERVGIGASG